LARRPEVRAGGIRRIVTTAGGGRARLEIFVARETLREQRRAADDAVRLNDQRAVGLVGEQRLAPGPDDQRVDAAQQQGEDERDESGGFKFGEEGFHGETKSVQTKCSVVMRTSMALMPMNGITMPPQP